MSLVSNSTHYEDFIGFTFDGIHSSDLHLYRVNDGGNRYTINMIPAFQDKTVQVGGRDETYLFNTNYQKREFQISVAFDDVGEEEFRKIQRWGADKKIHKLIFDEQPYKYYNVKLSKSPQLKYVCFDESKSLSRTGETLARKSRIYKGEGTFNFVCYENFGRGAILTKEEVYEAEPDLIKIYINKDCGEAVEIPIESLNEVNEVAIYLSSDIHNRGEWGAPNMNGDIPALGQYDPYTKKASTSYYVYQPQKVIVQPDVLNSTINLISDYQTYLYPINLKKGFIGTVDVYTGETNGKIVDATDAWYDLHDYQRKLEIVQYDPLLKITYGTSSSNDTTKYEEYGIYRWSGSGTDLVKLDSITNSIAKWNNGTLEITATDFRKVCQQVFDTEADAENYFEENEAQWDSEEKQKLFVVKQAANTLLIKGHSLYLQPNNEYQQYRAEVLFEKTDGEHMIRLEIDLVDSNDPVLEGWNNEETPAVFECLNCTSMARSCNKMGNYSEWIDYVDLPEKEANWTSGSSSINSMVIKNPGDWNMPFQAFYTFTESDNEYTIQGSRLYIDDDRSLTFDEIARIGSDVGVIIDTNLRVIRGYIINSNNERVLTNNIYNRYIVAGDFFYIPCGEVTLNSTNLKPSLVYEYRYL